MSEANDALVGQIVEAIKATDLEQRMELLEKAWPILERIDELAIDDYERLVANPAVNEVFPSLVVSTKVGVETLTFLADWLGGNITWGIERRHKNDADS